MVPKEKEKKKSGKLFCGNGIVEIEGKKNNLPLFFPSILAPQFFFRNDTFTIFSQYFHNKS